MGVSRKTRTQRIGQHSGIPQSGCTIGKIKYASSTGSNPFGGYESIQERKLIRLTILRPQARLVCNYVYLLLH